ncbi:hypothetical protein CKO40_21790 [Halochromatium glycolicum]|uniref:Uncharacterized protein n=1 Tax=Halochromatium glycolicum TaxID=85075 RepID=A0AAJ0XCR2_9GAMM|nr:hypothetical protein [Halochromatium glycolicum]
MALVWMSTAQAADCGTGEGPVKWDSFRSQGMGISVDYPVGAAFTEPRINSIQIACEARLQSAADDPDRLVYR